MDVAQGLVFAGKILFVAAKPLTIACVLLGLALLPRTARAGVSRPLAGMAWALLLVGSCGPVVRSLGQDLEWRYPPLPADARAPAIVLLGGGTEPIVPPRTEVEVSDAGDRILYAAELWRQGRAREIVVAGGRLAVDGRLGPEADDIERLLATMGVPREVIRSERLSRNTEENAVEVKRLLSQSGISRILLVTSAIHMPRAVALFQAQGFDVVPAPTDYRVVRRVPAASWAAWLWDTFFDLAPDARALAYTDDVIHERLGLVVAVLRGRAR